MITKRTVLVLGSGGELALMVFPRAVNLSGSWPRTSLLRESDTCGENNAA